MKFCKDCKYFKERYELDPRPPICKHPEAYMATDPVYGIKLYRNCTTMRSYSNPGCGTEAIYYEY